MAYITAVETLGPPVEPVSLPEAKSYLSVSTAADDVLIANCIAGARAACEEYAHISIVSKMWDIYLDAPPCEPVKLPWGQVKSIEFVKYAGPAESESDTIPWGGGSFGQADEQPSELILHPSKYTLRKNVQPSMLYIHDCPTPTVDIDGIWVRYKAGFGERPENVPITLKFAVLQMAAHLYRNREAVIVAETPNPAVVLPMAAQQTLDGFRMHWSAA
jgi:hypothetical protein